MKKILVLFCLVSSLPGLSTDTQARQELDLFEEFGIEVFEFDPKIQAKMKEQKAQEYRDALPDHILPETLVMDKALDETTLDVPAEPKWQGVEHETMAKDLNPKDCCMKAIRTSRYAVETKCLAQGHQVWRIESQPIKDQAITAINTYKKCAIFYADATKAQPEVADLDDDAYMKSKYFLCKARSVAQCFSPKYENAIFAQENDD